MSICAYTVSMLDCDELSVFANLCDDHTAVHYRIKLMYWVDFYVCTTQQKCKKIRDAFLGRDINNLW